MLLDQGDQDFCHQKSLKTANSTVDNQVGRDALSPDQRSLKTVNWIMTHVCWYHRCTDPALVTLVHAYNWPMPYITASYLYVKS